MKQFKVAFLFFISLYLILSSCKKDVKIECNNSVKVDSINIIIEKMRSNNFDLNTRLEFANNALQKSKKNNLKAKTYEILVFKSYLFSLLKKYDSAVVISHELINISIENNDSVKTGKYYSRLAYYYQRNVKIDSAFFFYNLAKDFFITIGDSINIGKNLAQIAIIQSDIGDYQESDKTAVKALIYLGHKNEKYLTATYNCIAISSKKQNDFKEAIYWYNKAIEVSNDQFNKIEYIGNKANAYRYLKNFNKSIFLFSELLKDSTLNSIPKTKARIIDNLVYTKWLANKNTNVLPELLNALEIRQQENDLYGLIASYSHLSDYYKQHNSTTALGYASKMYELAKKQKSPQDQLEALEKIIDLDKTSNTQKYFNSYIHISDSIKKAEQKAKNKFAKIKYDSKKNREENLQLKILNTQNELKIAEEKNQKIIISAVLGTVTLLFFGFVYFRKQKLQQEVYKTETRIAKKLHDEVANDMVSIMNKIQYTDYTSNQILDDLEKMYHLTRDISHENNTVETGKNFDIYLKTMLSSFNSNETTIIIKDIHNVELIKLSKEKQIEIARVLQELMINMQKHSEASLVAISFKKDKNNYLITYSDNGHGLNLKKLTLKSGLKNVETRIKSINGTINFESELNNGFKVFIGFKNNSYV